MTNLEQVGAFDPSENGWVMEPRPDGHYISREYALSAAAIDIREAEERAYRQGVEDMDEFRRAIVSECNDCVRTKLRGYVEVGEFNSLIDNCRVATCALYQVRNRARQRLERIGKGNG